MNSLLYEEGEFFFFLKKKRKIIVHTPKNTLVILFHDLICLRAGTRAVVMC